MKRRKTLTLVFDLDGTLYDATGMDKQNKKAAIVAISTARAISIPEAEKILLSKLEDSRESVSSSLRSLGITDKEFEHWQLEEIKPAEVLTHDAELVAVLKQAKERFQTVLFTNTRRTIALEALTTLGLEVSDFDYVFAGGDFTDPKPSVSSLKDILEAVGASPAQTYTIGDRWKIDHAPGIELGTHAVPVSGRDALLTWLRSTLSKSQDSQI